MNKLLPLALFSLLTIPMGFSAENSKEKAIGTTIGDFADIVKDSLGPALEKKRL